MQDDPKRLFVEMIGRLSRETQMHIDERQHHFEVNKKVITAVSLILVLIAAINIYLVQHLYYDLTGIINNMESMHGNMQKVSKKMTSITDRVVLFDTHMQHMDEITSNTAAMSVLLPEIGNSMSHMKDNILVINNDMKGMSHGMKHISHRFGQMTGGVATMRSNVRTISRPMGSMNSFMP